MQFFLLMIRVWLLRTIVLLVAKFYGAHKMYLTFLTRTNKSNHFSDTKTIEYTAKRCYGFLKRKLIIFQSTVIEYSSKIVSLLSKSDFS
jgi:hypothetical protein